MASTVGDRVRARREELGLSQGRLVEGLPLSAAYISLIETGKRQPQQRVLELLAKRLDCSVGYLTAGRGDDREANMLLELRFAELALASGDVCAARERFGQMLEQAARSHYDDVRLQALWGRSRADEALGRLQDAITGFLALAAERELPPSISRTALMMQLARVYGHCGEYDLAIEVGEAALAEARRAAADQVDNDEVTELASTLVGCYYMRGNLTQAAALGRQVIEEAERRCSPRARAAAYWNAGVVAEGRGDVVAALRYTERALAIYGELDNARAVASLRINYATLLLRTPDPDTTAIEDLLKRALDDMPNASSAVETAMAETELARCRLLAGRFDEAAHTAAAALGRLPEGSVLEAARARAVLGEAQLASGDAVAAAQSFGMAAEGLATLGGMRQAAEIWLQLAEAMSALGMGEAGRSAYREALRAAGVMPYQQYAAGSLPLW